MAWAPSRAKQDNGNANMVDQNLGIVTIPFKHSLYHDERQYTGPLHYIILIHQSLHHESHTVVTFLEALQDTLHSMYE
jgi:hypothetical protein